MLNSHIRKQGLKLYGKSIGAKQAKRAFASFVSKTTNLQTRLSFSSSIFIHQCFMMTLRKLPWGIPLIKSAPSKILTRQPSLVAEGTALAGKDYLDLKKILYYNNKYLVNLDLSQNVDDQSLAAYKTLFAINPKLFQHVYSVAYPKAQYSAISVNASFPETNIDNNNNLFVTEDVVIAATAGSLMKKADIFKEGTLTVLACDNHLGTKKDPLNKIAFAQTKQKHPDYHYVYKQTGQDARIWCRYYDFKAGQSQINSGHITCFSDKVEYEKKVASLLFAQYKLYMKNDLLAAAYKNILFDKTLTWSERNVKIQGFFKNNLQNLSEYNPSFVLHNPVLFEIDNQIIHKKFGGFIYLESVENVENTREMIAYAIYLGGRVCQEKYSKHPYGCPIILKIIKELLENNTEI